jgi:hypothetical protein
MNKQEEFKLKESRNDWKVTAIAFGLILGMICIALFIYPEKMGVYKQGFQDGQATCLTNYIDNMPNYIPYSNNLTGDTGTFNSTYDLGKVSN